MAELGPVDVALLPVAGYSPKLGPGHLDERRAAEAAALLRAARRRADPLGDVPRVQPARRASGSPAPGSGLRPTRRELAPDVDVRVLSPGGSLAL